MRTSATNFINALTTGGATVTITATYRPPQRAYLMHYSWRIVNQGLDPTTVPSLAGVDISWVHRTATGAVDRPASVAAAGAMVAAFQIAPGLTAPPALNSRHTQRRAIDIDIAWTGTLTLNDGNGASVSITTAPRNEQNAALWPVALSFGLAHSQLGQGDAPHYSDDGL
jgi:hypothetical protein